MLTGWTDFDRTFGAIDELRRRMERLFSEYDAGTYRQMAPYPPANLVDRGTSLVLECEVPGCTERDLEISVTQDGISLSGERKIEPPQGYSVLRRERQAIRFSRSFELPCRIDPEKTEATVKDGILRLELPKPAEAQPKRIEVKAQ
jgi:HSP20 family protein